MHHRVHGRLDEVLFTSTDTDRDDLTRRDLLEHLMQECAEVIQAASKCLLYGFDRNWPGYGVNHEVLQAEVNDVLGILSGLGINSQVHNTTVKLQKIAKWKQYMRLHHELGPQIGGSRMMKEHADKDVE